MPRSLSITAGFRFIILSIYENELNEDRRIVPQNGTDDNRKERLKTMGKGNRNRRSSLQSEAEDRYNHPENYRKSGAHKASKGGIQGKSGSQFPAWAGVLAIVLVAVIIAGALALTIINENGVILRSKTTLKTEHYKVSGTMLKYFYYYQYQTVYSTYYSYAINYLGNADYISYFGWTLNNNYAHNDELNNKCTLGTVLKDENGKEMTDANGNKLYDSRAMELRGGTVYTWWDYFMDLAIKQVEEILVYCEAAYDAGYTSLDSLNPEAYDEIDAVFASLKKNASEAGYSLSGYLTQIYGKGISKSDIRKALEISYIASEYAELVEENFGNAITDDEINDRYNSNKYDYLYVDALTLDYPFVYDELLEAYITDLGEDYTTEEYNEAVAKADEEFAVRLEYLRSISDKFGSTKGDEKAFKKMLLGIFGYAYYFDYYSEEKYGEVVIADVVAEAVDMAINATESISAKEDDPLVTRIAAVLYDEIDFLLYEDMTYSDNNLGNWAFKTVGQEYGNVFVVVTDTDGKETFYSYPELEYVDMEEKEEDSDEDESETEEDSGEEDSAEEDEEKDSTTEGDEKVTSEFEGASYNLEAYFMLEPATRAEYTTVDLGYILVNVNANADTTASDYVAPEFLAEDYLSKFLEGGDLTLEAFEKYAATTGESYYGTFENCLKGEFGYDELDEWLYDGESRVGTGDVIAIYGGNTSPVYYVAAYCFAEGDVAWYIEVKDDIVQEKFDSWEEEMLETYSEGIEINTSAVTMIG